MSIDVGVMTIHGIDNAEACLDEFLGVLGPDSTP